MVALEGLAAVIGVCWSSRSKIAVKILSHISAAFVYNAISYFADRWVSGRNHTPAKGAALNRGSRVQIPLCPPFFITFYKLSSLLITDKINLKTLNTLFHSQNIHSLSLLITYCFMKA